MWNAPRTEAHPRPDKGRPAGRPSSGPYSGRGGCRHGWPEGRFPGQLAPETREGVAQLARAFGAQLAWIDAATDMVRRVGARKEADMLGGALLRHGERRMDAASSPA